MPKVIATATGDNFLRKYTTPADKSFINDVQLYEKQVGSDGASNTVFTLNGSYVPDSNTLLVFVNGQKAEKVSSASSATEYEETSTNAVTFGASLLDTDVVEFYVTGTYQVDPTDLTNLVASGVIPTISFKNKLINGNFDFWQRATSQTTTGYNSADRWSFGYSAGNTVTRSRQAFTVGQTDVPGNPIYFLRTAITVADTESSDYVQNYQKVESVYSLEGKIATFSFWAKADTNRNLSIELTQEFGTGGSPSSTVINIGITKFALTTSWQKFTTTFLVPSIAGKTLGTNGDDAVRCNFWLSAGSDWDARTNSLGIQSGTFDIAHVQLEEGSIATPFEVRPPGVELALCQRYFEKNVNLDTILPSGNSDGICIVTARASSSTSTNGIAVPFRVSKRSDPTVTTYRRDGGGTNPNYWRYNATTYAEVSVAVGQNSFYVLLNGTGSGFTTGDAVSLDGHWTADSEL